MAYFDWFRCKAILLRVLSLALALMALASGRAHAAVSCGPPDPAGASVCQMDPTIDLAALCNDGTVPAFWVRPGHGTGLNSWVIWLEGGGDCVDTISCALRAYRPDTAIDLTSTGFTVTSAVGVLSPDPRINSALYNANTVFVHYCSSDYWSGGYASTTSFVWSDPTTWNFQGRRIALAAIASLNELNLNFAQAALIVLGGSSAGAIGMTVDANDILPTLPPAHDIRLVNDAGFALDIGQYDPQIAAPFIYTGQPNAFDLYFATAIGLWHGRGDAKCSAAATTLQAQIDCYDTATLLQLGDIALPSFVAESQIDTAQLGDQLCPHVYGHCPPPANPQSNQGQYATAFGNDMASTLIGAGTAAAYAVASPDIYVHVILTDQQAFLTPYAIPAGRISPRDVFNAWFSNPQGPRILSIGNGPGVSEVRTVQPAGR